MLTLSNTDSINNTGIKCLSWTFVLLIKSQKQTWLKEHQGPTLDASLMEVQLLYCNLIPRVLFHPSLASKRERERERDPGWVWSRVSRTKFILREEATILCGHPSPRRSSCLQAKGSTFISQPWLLVWPCILTSYSAVKCSADWANPALVKKSITSQKQSKSAITPNFPYTVVSNFSWENCFCKILGGWARVYMYYGTLKDSHLWNIW